MRLTTKHKMAALIMGGASLSMPTGHANAQEGSPANTNTQQFDRAAAQPEPYAIKWFNPSNDQQINLSLNGLVDHNGIVIDEEYAAEHFAGKKLLVYFGFPTCDVFCPPSTDAIHTVLSDKKFQDIVPVFISSEADQDADAVRGWIRHMGVQGNVNMLGTKEAIGITAGNAQGRHYLDQWYGAWKIHNSRGDHTPAVFAIDEQGRRIGAGLPLQKNPQFRQGDPWGELYLPNPNRLRSDLERVFDLQDSAPHLDTPHQPVQ